MFKNVSLFTTLVLIILQCNFCASDDDYVVIPKCRDAQKPLIVYPPQDIKLTPQWKDLQSEDLLYNYHLTYKFSYYDAKDDTYVTMSHDHYLKHMRNVTYRLFIPKFSLKAGRLYRITVNSKRKPSVTQGPIDAFQNGKKDCYVQIMVLHPRAVITGGYRRMVPSNKDIQVSGELSQDLNLRDRSSKSLLYSWNCTQKMQPPKFCLPNKVFNKKEFTIPAELARPDEIQIQLRTSLAYQPEKSEFAYQIINIVDNAIMLHVSCRKNCIPVDRFTNRDISTFLEVACVAYCEKLDEEDYEWTVKRDDLDIAFNYDEFSSTGRFGTKFIINPGVLAISKYTVEVNVKTSDGKVGYAAVVVEVAPPPNVTNCKITPPNGESLITLFKFSCNQEISSNETVLYELYAAQSDDLLRAELITSGYYPDVQKNEFKLPPTSKRTVFLTVRQEGHSSEQILLDVTVRSVLDGKTPKEAAKILSNIYKGETFQNSVRSRLKSIDPEERKRASQDLQSIIDEVSDSVIEDKGFKEFIEDFKYMATVDMHKVPIVSIHEGLRVGYALTKLHSYDVPEDSNPYLFNTMSTLCKKITDKSLQIVQNEEYPYQMEEEGRKIVSMMTECGEIYNKPNLVMMQPTSSDLGVEISVPDSEELGVNEEYGNYDDHDENHYKMLEFMKESSFNLQNGSMTAAKVLTLATATGEGLKRIQGNYSETVILKEYGYKIKEYEITSKGVVLIPPKDFEGDKHSYDILMVTWGYDVLSNLNLTQIKVLTDIVKIEFWHSTCQKRYGNFTHPVNIYFHLEEKIQFRQRISTYDHDFSDKPEDLNERMVVHRALLPRSQMIYFKFHDLTSTDEFEVVLRENSFPTDLDYEDRIIITAKHNHVALPNYYNYDVNFYVGIYSKNGTKLKYRISSFVVSCVRWVVNESRWVHACQQGMNSTDDVIHCTCTHFSVMAGYTDNVPAPIQEVMKPDLELVVTSTKVIFMTLAITMGVYLLLSMIALFHNRIQIYFLSDNNIKHKYAYLIIIRTGMAFDSGTSSNIVIKITGEKGHSEPHLLNFPDPQARILQTHGKDRFILTTERYLGEIKRIELWFDSIGSTPTWFCKDINVYDMQTHVETHFDINQRFSVTHGVDYFSKEIVPDHEKEEEKTLDGKKRLKSKLQFHWVQRYHTWYVWQQEENFSFLKKLTVILSTILTTYTSALIFHGLPAMTVLDSIDENVNYVINAYTVFIAFASSFPTFMVHISMAWVFRYSRIQLTKYRQVAILSLRYTLVCWSLLVIFITTSIVLLIVYGFWVPYNASLMWLTSCGIGILFGIVFYESFFIFVQNFFCKLEIVHSIARKFEDICKHVEEQREYLYQQFGEQLLRPYLHHLYKKLGRRQHRRKKIRMKRRYHVLSEVEDLIMFGVYFILLYLVILEERESDTVYGNRSLHDILEGKHTRTMDFHKIETVDDIYKYLNTTLIGSIQPEAWYGNFAISEPGLMIDVTNKYLGVVRLRQHRMERGSCDVAKEMRFLNMSCWPEFHLNHMETRTFSYSWKNFSSHVTLDRLRQIWHYTSEHDARTLAIFGEFATYSGGGYIAYLGRTLFNSVTNIAIYARNNWIDSESRVLFIEFLVYNANYNYFNDIRLMFEQSATGFIYKRIYVHTSRMLLVSNEVEILSMVTFIIFVIWVAIFISRKVYLIIKHHRTFFKDIWMLMDIVIIFLSAGCIICYGVRIQLVGDFLKKMEASKRNEFLNYFHLFYIEDFLQFCAAALVCISTCRLWKFLRFAVMFRRLERTLRKAAPHLLGFSFAFLIVVITFGLTLLLLVGNQFERIYSPKRIFRLLVTMLIKAGDMKLREYIIYPLVVAQFVVYTIFIPSVLFIFIVIIIRSYMEVQLEFSAEVHHYTVKDYIIDRTFYLMKYFKYKSHRFKHVRLKAGQEFEYYVEPKSDKFVYMNSFSIPTPKMRIMMLLTRCIIRNLVRKRGTFLTDYDIKLMFDVFSQFLLKHGEHEVEVFYEGRVKGNKIQVVNEHRIEMEANLTNLMLQEDLDFWFNVRRMGSEINQCLTAIRKKEDTLARCLVELKLLLDEIHDIHFH